MKQSQFFLLSGLAYLILSKLETLMGNHLTSVIWTLLSITFLIAGGIFTIIDRIESYDPTS